MSDELDQRIRDLEAERLRPVPPPPPRMPPGAAEAFNELMDQLTAVVGDKFTEDDDA